MGAFSTLQSYFILDISAHVACQFNFMANIILTLVAAFLGCFLETALAIPTLLTTDHRFSTTAIPTSRIIDHRFSTTAIPK